MPKRVDIPLHEGGAPAHAMGWCLVQTGTQRRLRLRPGAVQVGRAQTAQLRSTHQSVSRVHAEVVVDSVASAAEVSRPAIRLIDHSSTGHTFVNGRPSAGRGVPMALSDGDLLAFGVDPATYRVSWAPVVLSYSSRMAPPEVEAMESVARAAGVFVTSDWTPVCTHLLIEQLAITPKLLCCVACGGTPVAATFLEAVSATGSAEELPDARLHLPRPPSGVDAEYAAELSAYLERPAPRRGLLDGVWVIFAARQAREALALPLRHAGSHVHFLAQPSLAAELGCVWGSGPGAPLNSEQHSVRSHGAHPPLLFQT